MSGMRRAPRPSHGPVAIASSPWVVVLAGVVVMVVLLIVALGAYRGRSPAPDAGSPPPALPLPQVPPDPSGDPTPTSAGSSAAPLVPGLSPRASGLPSSGPAVSPTPMAGPTVTATRTPTRVPAGPPAVTGRYRVVQSFDGGFIGEVLVVNASGGPRGWTVRLEFSGGRLVTAWVEGAPQGTLRQFGGGFTYASGVDVPPGGSAPLRFHLERASTTPRGCTVDGVRCSGF
ncbi:cellulose binding domain-containing protein [Micromonospora sp. NPDC050695]|uniref:cellulose binding domain-containing protein n=1 Tax=Micromonospora sp. NPDC050695 TaxID=3154938 RepID=UPI0034005B88